MGSDGKDQLPYGGYGYLPQTPGLARLSSVYSLTFEEFQNTLGGIGRDFGSMNMDELLKSIWTAEETQAMAAAAAMGLPKSGEPGLQRQGSLTLPRTLSLKTVDEVWKDLFKENSVTGTGCGTSRVSGGGNLHPQKRQPTLGEITLEEFLVRAGVVREDAVRSEKPDMPAVSSDGVDANTSLFFGDLSVRNARDNAGLSLGFPSTSQGNGVAAMSLPIPSAEYNGANDVQASYNRSMRLGIQSDMGRVLEGGISRAGEPPLINPTMPMSVGFGSGGIAATAARSPMNPLSSERFSKNNGDLTSVSPVPYTFDRGIIKKASGMERAVERRQKRMIKNRESAARSRSRKQAYTIELEAEVAQLKEHNQELQKKQVELLEMQKKQALERSNQQKGCKKRCLRRTQTGPW